MSIIVQKYGHTRMMLPGGLSAVETGQGESTKGEYLVSIQISVWS